MAGIDVTVRGAGVFGLGVAWACARRGANVRVVDPNGVATGSSGGIVGALAPHVPENWNDKKEFQLESLLMAQSWWEQVAAAGGADPGYARLGRLQPVRDAAALDLARAREGSAAALWGEAAEWRVIKSAEAGTWAPITPTGWLIHDTLTARIHPRRACEALESALKAGGVEILREAPDVGAVVWATGWRGLSEIVNAHGRPVGTGVKGQAVLLRHHAGEVPQVFVDGLHVVPHADGTVAIGSTSEREFDAPDTSDAQSDALIEMAIHALPVLAGADLVRRWAGVRPRARSRAPVLGPWPGRAGHFVANGGFKIGFGIAPKVAEVMADLILEDRDSIPEGFLVEASL